MHVTTESAKNLICDIIGVAGGKLQGKTALDAAFYLAHLFHWHHHEGVLTQHPIARLPNGPGIDGGDELLSSLRQAGRIRITHQPNGPYPEEVYELTQPFSVDPTDPRHKVIRMALECMKGKSVAELSRWLQGYSRSWREARNGDLLNIYIDLLDDTQHKRIEDGLKHVEATFDAVVGGQAGKDTASVPL